MSNYLDSSTSTIDTELVLDKHSNTIHDPRNFSYFQKLKYNAIFHMMRPDLTNQDSYDWTYKLVRAERVIGQLSMILLNNTESFLFRLGDKYYDYTKEIRGQMLTLNNTRLQEKEATRVGSFEEVQMKVNFFDKIMDKIKGYEMLYPLGEFTFEGQAQYASTDVRQRQNAVKEKLLREMGVDYSILK